MKFLSAALLALITTASPAFAHEGQGRGYPAQPMRPTPAGQTAPHRPWRRPHVQRDTPRADWRRALAFHRALDQARAERLRVMQPWEPRYRAWLARTRREHAAWHARWDHRGAIDRSDDGISGGASSCGGWDDDHGHAH